MTLMKVVIRITLHCTSHLNHESMRVTSRWNCHWPHCCCCCCCCCWRNNERSFLTISSDYRKKLSWCRTGAGCSNQLSSHISAVSASPGLGALTSAHFPFFCYRHNTKKMIRPPLAPAIQSWVLQQCILDQCRGSRKPFPEDKDQTFLQTL